MGSLETSLLTALFPYSSLKNSLLMIHMNRTILNCLLLFVSESFDISDLDTNRFLENTMHDLYCRLYSFNNHVKPYEVSSNGKL